MVQNRKSQDRNPKYTLKTMRTTFLNLYTNQSTSNVKTSMIPVFNCKPKISFCLNDNRLYIADRKVNAIIAYKRK